MLNVSLRNFSVKVWKAIIYAFIRLETVERSRPQFYEATGEYQNAVTLWFLHSFLIAIFTFPDETEKLSPFFIQIHFET